MEPDICPPWWPFNLWWLLHHHGPGPDPGPIDREAFARLDGYFAAVSIAALANRLTDKKAGAEIGAIAGRTASNPMPGVIGLTQVARG